jgi:hypothetical protein
MKAYGGWRYTSTFPKVSVSFMLYLPYPRIWDRVNNRVADYDLAEGKVSSSTFYCCVCIVLYTGRIFYHYCKYGSCHVTSQLMEFIYAIKLPNMWSLLPGVVCWFCLLFLKIYNLILWITLLSLFVRSTGSCASQNKALTSWCFIR